MIDVDTGRPQCGYGNISDHSDASRRMRCIVRINMPRCTLGLLCSWFEIEIDSSAMKHAEHFHAFCLSILVVAFL